MAKQSNQYYQEVKRKYIEWKASTSEQREIRGDPLTQAEFAKKYDVAPRTVEDWGTKFRREVDDMRARNAVRSGGVLESGSVLDGDLNQLSRQDKFGVLIDRQIDAALAGDAEAMGWLRSNQQLMRPLIDALTQETVGELEGLSDRELVAALVEAFDVLVVERLVECGFKVVAPGVKGVSDG